MRERVLVLMAPWAPCCNNTSSTRPTVASALPSARNSRAPSMCRADAAGLDSRDPPHGFRAGATWWNQYIQRQCHLHARLRHGALHPRNQRGGRAPRPGSGRHGRGGDRSRPLGDRALWPTVRTASLSQMSSGPDSAMWTFASWSLLPGSRGGLARGRCRPAHGRDGLRYAQRQSSGVRDWRGGGGPAGARPPRNHDFWNHHGCQRSDALGTNNRSLLGLDSAYKSGRCRTELRAGR